MAFRATRRPPRRASRSAPSIAEVAFNIPLERSFHYLVPAEMRPHLQPGMRVVGPFGARERVGCVVRLVADSPIRTLKAIRRVIDPRPVIAGERWQLAAWISRYYACSLGEALAAMVPSALRLPATPPATTQSARAGAATAAVTLTPHQRRVEAVIRAAVTSSTFRAILLHGVTGSGKTELYLRAIALVLGRGRGAICLIPEIALTPQTVDRFRERFGALVAVWHSRLTNRQRAETWDQLAGGACRIVVGARSAVFAPLRAVGLIILDEEHETSYKQEDTPRYHARDVARARARLTGSTVLLGSATPSVESYYAASAGRDQLAGLPERVEGRPLPAVEIVDMREELGRRRAGPFSGRLERALQHAVEREEQVMLLLNRRGFSRVAQCPSCGTVVRCTRCSVPLIYHASQRALLCHYCNFHQPPAELCAECRKGYLRFRGSGTERIESELHRLFPMSRIARMDRDTTRSRESHRRVYDAVKAREVLLLVGTQMIAKGLDFPQVTLVGVVSADTALNLPDFRAGERTFDLLTQVAGRAGRGARPGRVLIQTFCPHHYAIQAAREHDYGRFYEEELGMRRRVRLPPFVHLIELTLRGSSRTRVAEAAEALAEALRRAIGRRRISLLGPAPPRIPRLRRAYRLCLMLKGRAVEPMGDVLRACLQPGRRFQGMPVTVDVDPL